MREGSKKNGSRFRVKVSQKKLFGWEWCVENCSFDQISTFFLFCLITRVFRTEKQPLFCANLRDENQKTRT